MLDVGWTELLLIGVVALIVIGPKDLPVMFHTLGRITARARGMAREFTSAMEDAAKASGVSEVTKDLADLKKMTSPKSMGLDALTRAADKFEKWDPLDPVRNAGAQPDPSAPKPPLGEDPAMRSKPAETASAAATPAADPKTTVADAVTPRTPGETASGLGLGIEKPSASPVSAPVSASAPEADPDPEHQPGARRLHAVRRSDRS